MADWGVITGAVGMVTGIYGAIIGHLGYRQSHRNKLRDLRMQLRKDVDAFNATLAELPKVMLAAKQSHIRVLAARGLGRSGNEQAFTTEWDQDEAATKVLVRQFAELGLNYSALSPIELERGLGDLNRLSLEGVRILEKYRAVFLDDDAQRSEIRAEQVALAAARASVPPRTTNKLGG
jgi:hypothetical protein